MSGIRVLRGTPGCDEDWLDWGKAASVEVTSEDENYPIESALRETRIGATFPRLNLPAANFGPGGKQGQTSN
jgi:hypothetical protein